MKKLLVVLCATGSLSVQADIVLRNQSTFPVVARIDNGPWTKTIAAGSSQVFEGNFATSTIEVWEAVKGDKKFQFEAGSQTKQIPGCGDGEYIFDGTRFELKAQCTDDLKPAIYPRSES